MKLKIIEADIENDKDIIIKILDQNREYRVDEKRYNWLYLNNPFGRAKSWMAVDEVSNHVIGAAAALPRLVWVEGKKVHSHVLSDFSINREYRSLGSPLRDLVY